MSIQRFKVALNNAVFPLVSTKAQRAVFVPGLDAAPRTPRIFMGADASADYNMSQIIYAENVVPVAEGVRSVGYSQLIPPSANTDFDAIFPLRDADENVVLFSPARGKNYIHNTGTNLWTASPTIPTIFGVALDAGSDPAASRVTYAYVDGKTFVCYSRLKSADSIAAPANLAGVGSTTGGTLAAGTYTYRVTAITEQGESVASTAAVVVTTGTTSKVTLTWDAVTSATGYRVFSKLGAGAESLLAETTATTYEALNNTSIGADVPPTTGTALVDMSVLFWNSATESLEPASSLLSNLPFPLGEIDGISSSSGYLLVWSGLTIAWAPFNGTTFDFQIYANGAFTGAGYQIPEDIQGPITAILGMAGGFIAFTKRNAIAANYHSQSIASPWVFREVPDAGGLESYEQATVEGSLARLHAYTSSGVQAMSLNSAEIVHPQVADFITGKQIERYDFTTHTLVRGSTTVNLYVKVTSIGNRYLVVSYGYYPGTYSYALVWDFALQRWGKLRIVHRDCFNYTYQAAANPITYAMMLDVTYADTAPATYADMVDSGEGITPAQNAMAFLKSTGEVVVATWSERPDAEDAAVVIIGRVQLSRSRNIQLNRIEVEGLTSGNVFIQASANGRNIDRVEETVEVERTANFLAAGCMIDCKNFNTVIEGTFDLSTVVLEAIPTGQI